MKKLIIYIIFILTIGVTLSMAETFDHNAAGMSIWFPDDWTISTEGDMLEASTPDETAYIQLLALSDVKTMDEAVDLYMQEMDNFVKNFKTIDEGENIEINGLNVFYVDGKGRVEGALMDISIALVVTKKAIVMIIAFSTEESTARYAKDFEEIVSSVKAI